MARLGGDGPDGGGGGGGGDVDEGPDGGGREPVTAVPLSARHVRGYLEKTASALEKLRVVAPPRSHLETLAEDFLDMAEAYYEDGEHFYAEGDLVSAFACVNYAHGWLDAGARLGLWDVEEDDQLFTLAG
jgi:hypothetical protein